MGLNGLGLDGNFCNRKKRVNRGTECNDCFLIYPYIFSYFSSFFSISFNRGSDGRGAVHSSISPFGFIIMNRGMLLI